jgi:hypothetical protein
VSALGGQSGGVRFGIGFDSDPQGRAPDRVSSVASDLAGNVFYSHNNVVPAEGQKLEELLALESQRMILAALQASDLPKDIASILNTLDAKTATADQIQKVIALAQSFQQLSDTIAALEGGPLVTLQQQLKALDGNVDAGQERIYRCARWQGSGRHHGGRAAARAGCAQSLPDRDQRGAPA